MRNPFEVFGLTPEMVGTLSERDLFTVLKAMYRALQKTVHPDVAGRRARRPVDGERAVELNLAFEAVNLDKNPLAFRRHRKSFVARRPSAAYRKSQALERAMLVQAAREERLAQAYLNRLVIDCGWSEAEPVRSPAGAPALASLPLKDVRLGLLDVAINQNLRTASWSLGSNYKEMNFDSGGGLSIRGVGRNRFRRAAYIHLLGAVPTEALELLPLLERPPARFFKAPALNASVGADSPSFSVLNRISPERFKSHVLAHLKPEVTERSYLFSLNRPEFEETGCLTLEGLVVKIDGLRAAAA
ncbi:MAG: J domain-containing protein [Candidatus Adiutrix sp.]|jgi:hypothetical protein|nr:J domain-containing protein [Candidatus Adiutrix sp.]